MVVWCRFILQTVLHFPTSMVTSSIQGRTRNRYRIGRSRFRPVTIGRLQRQRGVPLTSAAWQAADMLLQGTGPASAGAQRRCPQALRPSKVLSRSRINTPRRLLHRCNRDGLWDYVDGHGRSSMSSRLSPSGPSAGLRCLRYITTAPADWIAASVSVSAITGRPCSSQISPVVS